MKLLRPTFWCRVSFFGNRGNFGNNFKYCNFKLNDCFAANTAPFNVTGHPALSINAGFSDGLPVGMMIVGRKFDDATVLNVAYAYEKIRDASS